MTFASRMTSCLGCGPALMKASLWWMSSWYDTVRNPTSPPPSVPWGLRPRDEGEDGLVGTGTVQTGMEKRMADNASGRVPGTTENGTAVETGLLEVVAEAGRLDAS